MLSSFDTASKGERDSIEKNMFGFIANVRNKC